MTVKEALAHPTWAMGGKITIDSATLMNKGLELMEAHHLFGTPYERIDVVVHPQSLVHGLVQLADGAMLAHLGPPDMRIAISYALHGGESVRAADRRRSTCGGRRADASRRSTSTPSPACAWPERPPARAAPRRACSTPPTRSPCTRSSRAGCASWRSPR